jgi:predicted porin
MQQRVLKRAIFFCPIVAIVLCSSRSFAQSSVTIYGILDNGLEYLSNAPGPGGKPSSVFRETSGGRASSRLGFKGDEDLGGGIKAIFTLESGLNMTNGTLLQGGRLFGRQAMVGLSTPYGDFTAGRQRTPIYDYFTPLDPLDYSSYGLDDQDAQFVGRADNSIKYAASTGPFSIDALYSVGYDGTIVNGGPVPGSFRVGKEYDVGARYAQGPFYATVVYEQRQGQDVTTSGQKEQRLAAGASYAVVSPLKLFVGYEWFHSTITATAQRQTMIYGGVRYSVSVPLSVSAGTYYHDITSSSQRPVSFGVNADYALSKRTRLYLDVTYVKNSNDSNLGASGFASSIVAGQNQTGVLAGIVHLF